MDKFPETDVLNRVLDSIKNVIASRRGSAAYRGEKVDRVADRLEEQVQYFQYGLSGTFPPDWHCYLEEVEKSTDPEYSEFLRLRDKFEKKK